MANFFEGQVSLTPKEREEILKKGGPEALKTAEAKVQEATARIQAERRDNPKVIDLSGEKGRGRVVEKFSTESDVLAREARAKVNKAYEQGGEKVA